MTVSKDVIMDLLPIYAAGEASDDTRVLVEDHLQHDPQLARLAATIRSHLSAPPETMTPRGDLARTALERTRKLLRRRAWTLALALFFTFIPLAFAFSGGKVTFLMIRDAPGSALFWISAAYLWIQYYRLQQKLQISNL